MKTNKHPGLTVTFGLADLPMMASALSLARNTAMMYGREPQKQRFEELRKAFDAAIPYGARVFKRYDLYDIVNAVCAGAPYEVRAQRRDHWSPGHDVIAVVGGREYRSESQYRDGHETVVKAVLELFDELSPADGS